MPGHYRSPRAHAAYWADKVAWNRLRDARTDSVLKDAGWSVIRIWEHEDLVASANVIAETLAPSDSLHIEPQAGLFSGRIRTLDLSISVGEAGGGRSVAGTTQSSLISIPPFPKGMLLQGFACARLHSWATSHPGECKKDFRRLIAGRMGRRTRRHPMSYVIAPGPVRS